MSDAPVFADPSRPRSERVRDLLERLTTEEKIAWVQHASPAVPRLGLPAYDHWSEGLHGVARNGRATVFPQVIGLAATWDPDLARRIGAAVADEARAKHHAAARRHGRTGHYQGLHLWSPVVNLFRDPRWGRGQETWGEDPRLVGELGAAYVRGLQGDDPRYLKTAACAKHFAVHSGPERLRHGFDARVSLKDLHESYLPHFRALVDAGVAGVMGAYQRTNGAPCCAHPYLMGELLRGEWGFEGYFVSDCGAVADLQHGHGVAADPAEAAALALRCGCDLECGCTFRHLGEALDRGLVTTDDLDRALGRVLEVRFALGAFDPPEQVPYAAIPEEVVGCAEHRALAREAAVRSIVLLKNDGVLPLGPEVRSIRVLGPAAADVEVLLGSYHGQSARLTTLLEGIVGRLPEGVALEYRRGCRWVEESTIRQGWLFDPGTQPDVVIACLGSCPLIEGEEGDALASAEDGDRARLELPEVQERFLRELLGAGARVVLVLTGGGPIALGGLQDLVAAVLWVGYPGEAGGEAVADLLFGDAAPSGRLPVTFPRATEDLPPFEDYAMAGRTYRYATKEPAFPFGFGLSYARFVYTDLRAPSRVATGEGFAVEVTVRHEGGPDAEEVVQAYLSAPDEPGAPLASLVAFRRVALRAGEARTVRLEVPADGPTLVDDDGRRRPVPGRWRLTVGGCSPGARGVAPGAPAPLVAELRVDR